MHLRNMKGILPNFEFQFEKLFNCILSGRLKFLCTQCKLVEKGGAKAEKRQPARSSVLVEGVAAAALDRDPREVRVS